MRHDFPVLAWLLAWAGGVVLFLGPILAIIFLAAVRSLRQHGIPRPVFVTVRRVVGLLPIPSRSVRSIEGRAAFVAWDRRWLDGGTTTATITRADSNTRELELELHQPIGDVLSVTFKPHRRSRASYTFGAVRGTLTPPIDGVTATAEVLAYPA